MGRDFGAVTRTKTWRDPLKWNARAPELQEKLGRRVRVFCASLTDFFIQDADQWRDEAWQIIRECGNLDFLVLTKRPRLIQPRLPNDWVNGYPNVWLGSTCGVRSSYPRLDDLRGIPAVVRFISAEPLLEPMPDINLAGYHWLIAGGESGSGFREMKDEWALELRDRCRERGVAFHFKQHSAFRPGTGSALQGVEYRESPLVQITTAATSEAADGRSITNG